MHVVGETKKWNFGDFHGYIFGLSRDPKWRRYRKKSFWHPSLAIRIVLSHNFSTSWSVQILKTMGVKLHTLWFHFYLTTVLQFCIWKITQQVHIKFVMLTEQSHVCTVYKTLMAERGPKTTLLFHFICLECLQMESCAKICSSIYIAERYWNIWSSLICTHIRLCSFCHAQNHYPNTLSDWCVLNQHQLGMASYTWPFA